MGLCIMLHVLDLRSPPLLGHFFWGIFWGSKKSPSSSSLKSPKECPKSPQQHPKSAPRTPESAPRASQGLPRVSQEHPKSALALLGSGFAATGSEKRLRVLRGQEGFSHFVVRTK